MMLYGDFSILPDLSGDKFLGFSNTGSESFIGWNLDQTKAHSIIEY